MGLLTFVLFGLIVGLIARLLHPGRDAMGWIMTIVLGIGGSFLGLFVGKLLGMYRDVGHFQPAGFIMSVLGAIALLMTWHFVQRRRGVENR